MSSKFVYNFTRRLFNHHYHKNFKPCSDHFLNVNFNPNIFKRYAATWYPDKKFFEFFETINILHFFKYIKIFLHSKRNYVCTM